MDIQELYVYYPEEEIKELQNYQYTEVNIDKVIEEIKELQEEINRFEELYNQRVEQLKIDKDIKVEKIQKKIDWHLFNLGNIVKNDPKAKSTKTQIKKEYLSGSVVVKKSYEKMQPPKLDEETIKEKFADYKKEKLELKWKELKEHCDIKNGKVINTVTGEDLSDYIQVEVVPEKVEIK